MERSGASCQRQWLDSLPTVVNMPGNTCIKPDVYMHICAMQCPPAWTNPRGLTELLLS